MVKLNEILRNWMIRLRTCGKDAGTLLGCLLGISLLTRTCSLPRRIKKVKVATILRVGLVDGSRWSNRSPEKAILLEKELVKIANSMPRSQFLRNYTKVSTDIEGPALDMDLCTTSQPVHPQVLSTLLDNEVQEVIDDPFGDDLNDPVVTTIG